MRVILEENKSQNPRRVVVEEQADDLKLHEVCQLMRSALLAMGYVESSVNEFISPERIEAEEEKIRALNAFRPIAFSLLQAARRRIAQAKEEKEASERAKRTSKKRNRNAKAKPSAK